MSRQAHEMAASPGETGAIRMMIMNTRMDPIIKLPKHPRMGKCQLICQAPRHGEWDDAHIVDDVVADDDKDDTRGVERLPVRVSLVLLDSAAQYQCEKPALVQYGR